MKLLRITPASSNLPVAINPYYVIEISDSGDGRAILKLNGISSAYTLITSESYARVLRKYDRC